MLAVTYSLVVPAWEAPDENLHYDYARHLLLHRELPVQAPQTDGPSEAHQPPLYYMTAALIAWPADIGGERGAFRPNPTFIGSLTGSDVNRALHGTAETFPYREQALALHLMRLASIAMGALTVFLVLKIGWELFPPRPEIGVLGAGLVAFNPQFLFISSSINNDNLLMLAATGAWWQLLRAIREEGRWRQWLFVGLWLAAAVLAKPSGLVIGLVVALALAAVSLREGSFRLLLKGGAAVVVPVLVLSGWWFLRNQLLYGDPLGWSAFSQIYRAVFRTEPLAWADIVDFFTTQFDSFWGVFGWTTVRAPGWFYLIVRLLALAGAAGLAKMWLDRRRRLSAGQRISLSVLVLAIVAFEAYLLWAIGRFNDTWYQGRYLFPVIAPAMSLLALGLWHLLPPRWARPAAVGIPSVMLGMSLFLLLAVIRPAFASPPLAKWEAGRQLRTANLVDDVTFGEQFHLLGYETRVNEAGDKLHVTLYWEALQDIDFDFSAFVHLIDAGGRRVAQDDHPPGELSEFRPKRWWPEDVVVARYTVPLPEELAAGPYRLWVGVYHWGTGDRLPAYRRGRPAGGYVVLEPGALPTE